MQRIAILGDGSWGTACATILAYNQIPVTLWCYNEEVATAITQQQENRTYLPNIPLNTTYIHPTTSYKEAVADADIVYFAIPVTYLRSVLSECLPYMHTGQTWISLSKGMEQETYMFPTEIVASIAPAAIQTGVIAGPSFAREVAQHKATGLLCATPSYEDAQSIIDAFTTDYTTITYTDDVIGAQITGALKNVYALASGIIDAHTESHNTQALLMTRALNEMKCVFVHCGGSRDTLLSLAGVGDLILTCSGSQSRNRTVGQKIGSGVSLHTYLTQVDFVPESINTARAIIELLDKHSISAPIIHTVYDIIHNDASADTLMTTLMS